MNDDERPYDHPAPDVAAGALFLIHLVTAVILALAWMLLRRFVKGE